MRRYLKVLTAALLLPCAAFASESHVQYKGEFTQGGLVVGSTQPGAKVVLDGEVVQVFPDGTFYIGFSRDAAAEAKIKIALPNGDTEEARLSIKPREYDIQKLKLPEKMVTPPKEVTARIAEDNRIIKEKRQRISQPCQFKGVFQKPAEGRISGVYGSQRILNDKPKDPHMGLDIAAPVGTPVVAPEAGVVTLVRDMYYTGNTVLLDHGCGVFTVYAHLEKVAIKAGQVLKVGEQIGTMGATGRATGPHLHWGLNLVNLRLDPSLPLQ
jgi:murein DD-endopeptidase MepM/ murein hydrolase activator NlpD